MPQYEIRVKATAEGALRLAGASPPDDQLHGRSLVVSATFVGEELDEQGFLGSERSLRAQLDSVVAELDHSYLNELPQFANTNPSAENIARWVAERLPKLALPGGNA